MIDSTQKYTDFPAPQYAGKLVIFTSFYEGRAFAGYTHSITLTAMVLSKCGIQWDWWCSSGDFHIERAVNKALTNFLESDFTDFLMIDSDEAWNPDGLLRVIGHNKEVVGAAYRKKNRWNQWTATISINDQGTPDGEMTPTGPLIKALRLPGGFLRVTKPALEKFIKAFPDRWYWDNDDQTPGVEAKRVKVYQFFTTATPDHEFMSQDFVFSEALKAAGVELWLEPNITIGHHGLTEYVGNLDKYLRDLKESQSRTPLENIEAFAKQVRETA